MLERVPSDVVPWKGGTSSPAVETSTIIEAKKECSFERFLNLVTELADILLHLVK